MALSARADQMSVSATSSSSSTSSFSMLNGQWTVSGFDPSLGTLTAVEVLVTAELLSRITNISDESILYDSPQVMDESLSQPDNSPFGNMFASSSAVDDLDPGFAAGFNLSPSNFSETFTDPSILSEYTGSTVSLGYQGSYGLEAPAPAGLSFTNQLETDL